MLMKIAINYLIIWWIKGRKRPWSHFLSVMFACLLFNILMFIATFIMVTTGFITKAEVEFVYGNEVKYVVKEFTTIFIFTFLVVPSLILIETSRRKRKETRKSLEQTTDQSIS